MDRLPNVTGRHTNETKSKVWNNIENVILLKKGRGRRQIRSNRTYMKSIGQVPGKVAILIDNAL